MMNLDILAIGIHPDDVELGCGATLAKMVALGKQVGILHLTHGELGTRGTPETRLKESEKAAQILGVQHLAQLDFKDGYFTNDDQHQTLLIEQIRRFRPKMVLANAVEDRHPDHGRAAKLIAEACFYSGLSKIQTQWDGKSQVAFRPTQVHHYIQWNNLKPDFCVDVSGYLDLKMQACLAYGSQFFDPKSTEPNTPITSKNFMESIRYRAMDWGRIIGTDAAEGFISSRVVAVNDLEDLI